MGPFKVETLRVLRNGEPEDELRRLVIAYYLADDEVAVFEAQGKSQNFEFHPTESCRVGSRMDFT